MKVLNLLQDKIVPKPKEYQLRQKHELTGPKQLWEMDMVQIYIVNSGQWVYMFYIIDVFIKEIVGHHEGLRTDNGTQFRSREFQTMIKKLEISHEKIMVNIPEENGYIESFHGTLIRCEVYRKHYRNINHCRNSIAKFIDKYNNKSPHSSVGKISPAVYRKNILNNLISGIKFAA